MFKKFTNGCVRVVNRWLPDAFLFAIILSIIVFIGSMCATKMGPLQVLNAWGDSKGFWGLLSFSMQMALVLVFGSAMAAAKPCKKALRAAAGLCHNNMQAIVVTTFIRHGVPPHEPDHGGRHSVCHAPCELRHASR